MVGLGDSGTITVSVGPANVSSDVVVDLEGYYAVASQAGQGLYQPLSPKRIADTRCSVAIPPSYCGTENLPPDNGGLGALTPGGSEAVRVAGDGGVPPSGVSAVVLNVTAVGYTKAGYLTVYPAGETARTWR